MSEAICPTCGGRPSQCGTGCEIANMIPRSDEGLPVSGALIAVMSVVFALFNQVLMASVSLVKEVQGDLVLANRFALVSLVLGIVILIFSISLLSRLDRRKLFDWIVVGLGILIGGIGFALGDGLRFSELLWALVICNLLIGIWLLRGVLRFALTKSQ